MKKLNRKGFTLIELLAVIVILAIIVVITVPTVLNSINDARLSSIHSLSKEVANWYDESAAQDLIALDPSKKILKGATATDKWQCLNDIVDSDGESLFDLYGLSDTDLVRVGWIDEYTITDEGLAAEPFDGSECSAIRIVNGKAQVFLSSKPGGKFDTKGRINTYAVSFASNGRDDE